MPRDKTTPVPLIKSLSGSPETKYFENSHSLDHTSGSSGPLDHTSGPSGPPDHTNGPSGPLDHTNGPPGLQMVHLKIKGFKAHLIRLKVVIHTHTGRPRSYDLAPATTYR